MLQNYKSIYFNVLDNIFKMANLVTKLYQLAECLRLVNIVSERGGDWRHVRWNRYLDSFIIINFL